VRNRKPIKWIVVTGVYFGAIVFVHPRILPLIGTLNITDLSVNLWFRWSYVLSYLALGFLLLGAVSRIYVSAAFAIWRMMMLLTGSLLAALDLWLQDMFYGEPMRVQTWMTSLLGLVLAALLVRGLPESLLRRWLNLERRDS
jgi:hypothetical protein